MLVLDTNVVSEMMRRRPNERVADWFQQQPISQLALTSISLAELLYGLDRLPDRRRKGDLTQRLTTIVARYFAGRVLAFDQVAAAAYATIKGSRDRIGRPLVGYDAMIAAIARVHRAPIVTRNVTDFSTLDLVVINPWDD